MAEVASGIRRRRGGGARSGDVVESSSRGVGGNHGEGEGNQDGGGGGGGGSRFMELLRKNFWSSVWRMIFIYTLLTYMGGESNSKGGGGGGGMLGGLFGGKGGKGGLGGLFGGAGVGDGGKRYSEGLMDIGMRNVWDYGRGFGLRVYVGEENGLRFRGGLGVMGREGLVWEERGLVYRFVEDGGNDRGKNVSMVLGDDVVSRNASVWIHGVVYDERVDLKSEEDVRKGLDNGRILVASDRLITWHEDLSEKVGKNLLEKQDKNDDKLDAESKNTKIIPEKKEKKIISYLKPQMTLELVNDFTKTTIRKLPPPIAEKFTFRPDRGVYYPPMHWSNFWTLREQLVPINETLAGKDSVVEINFQLKSFFKTFLYVQFDTVMKTQKEAGILSEKDGDEMKRMFLETNPYLLALTMAVSMAHSILSVLAFSNDIGHWQNLKSLEGVSVRSLSWQMAMEVIIFLYLLDNETSWMILIGNGVGIAIAVWKIGKAVKVVSFGERKLLGVIPWFVYEDRESYSKKTKEYDDEAMRYLSYALYPLVFCYSIYSLVYETHKSWYSWVIGSLVGAVYTFGFILMFPQIFINYKLKSVAHLPMKAMMYKTLNTIIDDMFSFIIKMPWMHRLACFRDDIVFVVFLYQRWIYPVDKTRVNEFGQEFRDEVEKDKRKSRKKIVKGRKVVNKVKGNEEPVLNGHDAKDTESTIESESVVQKDEVSKKTD